MVIILIVVIIVTVQTSGSILFKIMGSAFTGCHEEHESDIQNGGHNYWSDLHVLSDRIWRVFKIRGTLFWG